MSFLTEFKNKLNTLTSNAFEASALELFRFQASHNNVYKTYLQHLGCKPETIQSLIEIPYLPIGFFKTHRVVSHTFPPKAIFKSSGTTLQQRSQHYVADPSFYCQHAQHLFEKVYGPLAEATVLALLPSYLEQGDSSLVMMVEYFMKASGQQEQGFFLKNHQDLKYAVRKAREQGRKVYLFGVTYALLDLAEEVAEGEISDVIIFETGGMKGRRREMIREELHHLLTQAFGVPHIHSEYGMTELLSQAYSMGQGVFQPSQTLRVLVRDVNDPFAISAVGPASGGVNVVDLANVDSCAFIETKDLGKLYSDGSFEILGRFDNADIRGCNLLVG